MTVLPTSVEEIRKNVGSRQDVNQNRIYTHHAPPTKTEKENVQKWVGSQNDGLYEYKDVLMIGIKIYHTYHFDENIKKKCMFTFLSLKKGENDAENFKTITMICTLIKRINMCKC